MGNAIVEKSFSFGVDIVKAVRSLRASREYELASQLLRSGTSVGANVAEAQKALNGVPTDRKSAGIRTTINVNYQNKTRERQNDKVLIFWF